MTATASIKNSAAGRTDKAAFRAKRALDLQGEFDFLFGHNHPLLFVEEVAHALRCSDQTVRNRIDDGTMLAFCVNVEESPKRERLLVLHSTAVPNLEQSPEWAELIDSVNQWLFPHKRDVVTVREVALALKCSGMHVRALWEANQLGKSFEVSKRGGENQHLRFSRTGIVGFVKRRILAKVGATCAIETKGEKV